MPESLTTISWSDPATVGIIVGVVAVIAIAGYLWWAWSEKQWPFYSNNKIF